MSLGQLLPTFRKERSVFVRKSYGVQEEAQHPKRLAYEGDMSLRNAAELKPSESHSGRPEYILLLPDNRRTNCNVVKKELV